MEVRDIIAPVKAEMQQLEEAFQSLVSSDISLITDVLTYLVQQRGKRIRPTLVFLSCGLNGGNPASCIDEALAVELLHIASLVHDDVVDESALRRGAATINHKWSNKISVLIGDLLFSKVLSLLEKKDDRESLRILTSTTEYMSKGELLQIEQNDEYNLTEDEYFTLISYKTGYLISACCQFGARAANADNERIEVMKRFGEQLGIAFQIRDDILDLIGDSKTLGKPVANDIQNNKITLPMLSALKMVDAKKAQSILEIMRNNPDPEQIDEVVQFIDDHGGIQDAEKQAQKFKNNALKLLDGFKPSPYKTALEGMVEFVSDRTK